MHFGICSFTVQVHVQGFSYPSLSIQLSSFVYYMNHSNEWRLFSIIEIEYRMANAILIRFHMKLWTECLVFLSHY
jgi:hypothetical protein